MIVKITGSVMPENEDSMNKALDDGNWQTILSYMDFINAEVLENE